jgi:hypothetical protein
MGSVLEESKRLSSLGYNVLPTRRGKKSPGIESWKQYQTKRSDAMVESWWSTGSRYVGVWTVTGKISELAVLDCDSPEAEAFCERYIGAEMRATARVKTSKGHHYWFRLEAGEEIESWALHEGVVSLDFKAEGGGVMTPPSPHPDGGFYSWEVDIEEILPCPSWLKDRGVGAKARLKGEMTTEGNGGPDDGPGEEAPQVRSMLDQLLNNPPTEGGRNEWLIRVCGHLARMVPFVDAYHALVKQANKSLDTPLDDAEVVKTATSAWEMEQSKGHTTIEQLREQGIQAGEPNESNGFLISGGIAILCTALVERNDKKQEVLLPWSDFDIEVLGVIESGEKTDYLVKLHTTRKVIECKINGATIGSTRELIIWLAERQCSIVAPVGDNHPRIAVSARLLRYVKSQDAPVYQSVDALGWNDEAGGFICHEGIIRAGVIEAAAFGDTRPAPILQEWAPYHYGFVGTREGAQAVLREVLTFHDETVCAVYGAWWAACFLKEQIIGQTALFPFMALEAPSESGKTTGFFSLMMQMSGNTEGHGEYTMAVLRDRVSSHKNGPVWVDDISNPESTLDLIRQATSGGSRSKKGDNRHSQETVTFVSPIVMSAEGLQALSTEKALADRAIRLTVPSPVDRRSLNDSSKPQWDDIVNLQLQWRRDLTQLAGHYASLALECLPMVESLGELRLGGVGGRFNDSMAILRLGARVLEHMGATSDVISTVDAWTHSQMTDYDPNANLLTQAILPWMWRELGYPANSNHGSVVFRDKDGAIYYREEALADAWRARHGLTARERQLGSLDSIRDQRRRLGIEGVGVGRRVRPDSDHKVRYQRLGVEESRAVVELSGWADVEEGKML